MNVWRRCDGRRPSSAPLDGAALTELTKMTPGAALERIPPLELAHEKEMHAIHGRAPLFFLSAMALQEVGGMTFEAGRADAWVAHGALSLWCPPV